MYTLSCLTLPLKRGLLDGSCYAVQAWGWIANCTNGRQQQGHCKPDAWQSARGWLLRHMNAVRQALQQANKCPRTVILIPDNAGIEPHAVGSELQCLSPEPLRHVSDNKRGDYQKHELERGQAGKTRGLRRLGMGTSGVGIRPGIRTRGSPP